MISSFAMKLLFQNSHGERSPSVPSRAEFPPLSGAEIAGRVHGQRVGGDFYHFLRATRSRVVFGLLDIAGRYEENQAIVEAARQTFQRVGKDRFGYEEINEADAMMEFCLELNLSIRRAAAGVRSCAAFLGCYNEDLGTICYANAGHTPGLLRDAEEIVELPATGMPLGLFSASTYEAPTAALPGGALLLVSRGVVEASDKREEFGLERVKQHFLQAPRDSADQIASHMLDVVQQFLRSPASQNDMTALALVRKSPVD
jgi:serine phosphatase RsbU (regulator of sigma subunit)